MSGDGSHSNATHDGQPDTRARDLARELTGDLFCARCGYNLRGLSILGVCGECGLPVKATILAVVDPRADEIRDIDRPRLVQAGMILWAGAAFAACIAVAVIRAAEVLERYRLPAYAPRWMPLAAVGLIVLSGLGSLVLARPHGGFSRRAATRARLGSACYLPLAASVWWVLTRIDAGSAGVYTSVGDIPPQRSALRIAAGLAIIGAALLLRPNALRLALRSVLVRTGRVDRQPMTALAAAAALAMVGDLLHLLVPYAPGGSGDLMAIAGTAAIAAGSFLLTVGLYSLTLDVFRIRPLIAAPGIGLTDIFDEGTTA
jgi:hypothetical protein